MFLRSRVGLAFGFALVVVIALGGCGVSVDAFPARRSGDGLGLTLFEVGIDGTSTSDKVRRLCASAARHAEGGRWESALRDADVALEIDEDSASARVIRGAVRARVGRYQEALTDLDVAHRIAGDDERVVFAVAYVRAETFRRYGRLREALTEIDMALALRPGEITVLPLRAAILGGLGRLDESLADIDKAIAVAPNESASHMIRGLTLLELRRFDASIAAFDQAIALGAGDPARHYRQVAITRSRR